MFLHTHGQTLSFWWVCSEGGLNGMAMGKVKFGLLQGRLHGRPVVLSVLPEDSEKQEMGRSVVTYG